MTTRDFRWLHPEAWNDDHYESFLRLRQGAASGLYAPPPFVHPRRRVPPRMIGRWLLETDADGCLATVEVEVLETNFKVLHVLVSPFVGPTGWEASQASSALSLMLSGLMIMTRADLLRVVPLSAAVGGEIGRLGWGATQEVDAFVDGGGMATPIRLQTLTVDPHQWWESEHGQADHITLSYLEKRVHNEESRATAGSRTRRRRPGLLTLLSRLLRWH